MVKRQAGVGRPTNTARELEASEKRNQELEEIIRALQSEEGVALAIGEPFKAGDSEQIRPAGSDGDSDGDSGEPERSDGVWINDVGNLCIGRECMVTEATPEGLRFILDPEKCDPKTRETLVNAMLKGSRISLPDGR